MFRTEAQAHAAIRALLGTIVSDVDRWWMEAGPTEQTWSLVEGRGDGALSSGQALLVRAGVDLWNGQGHADLGKVFATLSNEPLAALGSLLVAVTRGPEAIDAWIAEAAVS